MPAKKRPLAPKTYSGTGDTVEEAAESAWKRASGAGNKAGWYRVISIEFYADNPIRDYKVTISGGG
jgi:flavin-binding protein dodecin